MSNKRISLVAGSYERFIWGFTLHPKKQTLTPLFSYPSHLSLIKTLAVSGSVVASGGSDDTIHLYNLSAASSLGSLNQHSSTVNALSFYSPPDLPYPRNLISADADGNLCIFDADGFVHLKTLSVHRKGVNDLALHPSGKLALTVGRDHCLAMVNLVRGRRSFCCRLDKEATLVRYDAAGDTFFMATEEIVSVHQAEDARLLFELQCPKRVLCAAPARNGLLYTGGEDRNITAWDINSGKVAYCMEEAHTARIKGIVVLTDSDGATGGDDPYLVASASSDGTIRVWDVRMAATEKPNPLAECKTQARLTCLAGSCMKFKQSQAGKGNPEAEDQMIEG
ncbi:WD40/YVTN repeat-like-containing domain superfamily [Sesbania bispinosa]|nr:WD40/YVTN repeat-like-containing domain superfamily [Sesbania bispinosa]